MLVPLVCECVAAGDESGDEAVVAEDESELDFGVEAGGYDSSDERPSLTRRNSMHPVTLRRDRGIELRCCLVFGIESVSLCAAVAKLY